MHFPIRLTKLGWIYCNPPSELLKAKSRTPKHEPKVMALNFGGDSRIRLSVQTLGKRMSKRSLVFEAISPSHPIMKCLHSLSISRAAIIHQTRSLQIGITTCLLRSTPLLPQPCRFSIQARLNDSWKCELLFKPSTPWLPENNIMFCWMACHEFRRPFLKLKLFS